MKNLGYYCVNVMGGGDGIYNGVTRGFDRLITTPYDLQMYAGVERVIRQLESFGECDQFLLLHVMDTHPWNMSEYQINTTAQTRLNLSDRLRDACRRTPSVYLPNAPAYQTDNRCGIRQVDRSLKTLFDYINEHYRPDEYVIMLYSDHGVPIYDEEPYLFSECQNNATLMLRGAGVPNCGFAEELVSSLDIYKIMAHLHGFQTPDYLDGNLPAVFGGIEREYVIGNSIYPGQTYKLAIRTQKYECELETKGAVEKDGTVDLTDADICIYTRDAAHKRINDKAVYQYFASIIENHTQTFNNRGLVWSD